MVETRIPVEALTRPNSRGEAIGVSPAGELPESLQQFVSEDGKSLCIPDGCSIPLDQIQAHCTSMGAISLASSTGLTTISGADLTCAIAPADTMSVQTPVIDEGAVTLAWHNFRLRRQVDGAYEEAEFRKCVRTAIEAHLKK